MKKKQVLMKGNEAMAEGAIMAGCRYFFGYPITPQNEVPAHMAVSMPRAGGVFIQAESELAAINMVYGAAGAGARVMTSSSSPGISLKQEGISYLVGAELPCVIANIMRGGPGLGGIQPSQSDYYQAVKGGGHGDYRLIVLTPNSVQEMADLTMLAFDLADIYRNPVMILGDGNLGQMMEPVSFCKFRKRKLPPKDWATTGTAGRSRNIVKSLYLIPEQLEAHNRKLYRKFQTMKRCEVRFEEDIPEGCELLLTAFGTTARICRDVVDKLRQRGHKAGLFRPITLFPFPEERIKEVSSWVKAVMTVEMNMGQMVDDVRLAVEGRCPVHFYGRTGGVVPSVEEIVHEAGKILRGIKK
jgi:2-oxoglutarate ferredoxin oxidoreductase subunit alpha